MRHLSSVILATTAVLAGCTMEEDLPELGVTAQEAGGDGDFMQGDFMQGTGLGDFMQGDFMQGQADVVWGFDTTGWLNSGFKLKNTGVVQGHLVAQWDKTAPCGPTNTSPSRTCDWHTPGHAFCVPYSTVTVRAGGCAASPAQRSMIRICNGRKPCAYSAALATADAACSGTTNPAVTFTCPSTGRYFVMVGPKAAGFGTPSSSFTYTLQATPFSVFATALSGADFNGTTLAGHHDGGPLRYRISANPQVFTGDAQGTTSFYTLHQDNPGALPLCVGTDNRAIPVAGLWNPDGTVNPTVSTKFTFACTLGVIAKCYMHGYYPWATHDGVSLRDHHQTCTRAARADFCGDGVPHTVNGTTIDLYDGIGRVAANPDNTVMKLEAIWRRETTGETPFGEAAVCLSKKRWDTIPYGAGGQCPGLSDPRLHAWETRGPYCEDLPAETWLDLELNPANLIATESANYDAGLWRWRKGGDFRSTTACTTVDDPTTTEDDSPCLADGYQLAPATEPVLLGSVYHVELHPDLRPTGTIPLYTYRNAAGRYLTTTDPPLPGYGEGVVEGYIFNTSCEHTSSCFDRPRLELWQGNGGYVTTIAGEDPPGAGYVHWKTLGYLPR